MRKAFILPSLEVKRFNRESILTTSNLTNAKNALNNSQVSIQSVAVKALNK